MLKGQKRYWLVASSDDNNAPTFLGGWHLSNVSQAGGFSPGGTWFYNPGAWPAAEIRGGRLQSSTQAEPSKVEATTWQPTSPSAAVTIFTNLGPAPDILYNYAAGGFYVAGNNAADVSELWLALPFKVSAAVHAKTLAAAIGYISGTKKVNLGIYSDNDGAVGTLLPGGQGSTAQIPDLDTCCDLATVTLPGAGVALSPGRYWLGASPDDGAAPDFEGEWQMSNFAYTAFRYPEDLGNWITATGLWLAAEIKGTNP